MNLKAIYYHSDFDGIVSASMLYRFVGKVSNLYPVDYHLQKDWANKHLLRPSAIVDFLYHPDATFWFDHHSNPFVKASWRNSFFETSKQIWRPRAPSCPPVILEALPFTEVDKAHFAEYIHWSSVIDSALYMSVEEATDSHNPFIKLSRVIPIIKDAAKSEMVKLIAHNRVSAVLQHPFIVAGLKLIEHIDDTISENLTDLMQFDGIVVKLDQSSYDWPYQRYQAYKFYPKARFVVGIYKARQLFTVSVGPNPWQMPPDIDIGTICRRWGGGGHKTVGGMMFANVKAAKEAADEVVSTLHFTTDFAQSNEGRE